MRTRSPTQTKALPTSSLTPVHSGLLQRQCACGKSAKLTGDCRECQDKRLTLQRRGTNQIEPVEVPPIVHEVLNSPGQPLDLNTRAFMESRFGHDFSQVRVHTDTKAAESAWAVNALAYTVGRDVVFGTGQYAPHSTEGRRLVAHELTHVIQQVADAGNSLQVGLAHDVAENEAAKVATIITTNQAVTVNNHVASTIVMRQQENENPGLLGTVGGGLLGEFNEDPNFAMIGVDFAVSLIPILDQASDIRDTIAHFYYLIFQQQYDRFMRWLGLVFTLIGLIPEVGSAIKGASKFIIRGVSDALNHLFDILQPFRRIFPEIADLRRLQDYVTRNWSRFVALGMEYWSRTISRVSSIVNTIPTALNRRVQQIRDGLARIQQLAPTKLSDAFAWVKRQWDNVLEAIQERLQRRRRIAPEIDQDVERSFQQTFTEPAPPSAPLQTGPVSPERAAGFTAAQITGFRRFLSKPLMHPDTQVIGNIWNQVANPAEVTSLTLANSRQFFDNHRRRFWRAVRNDPQARQIFLDAGCIFPSGSGTAPIYRLTSGQEITLTIDHIIERQTNPGLALNPLNLRIVFSRENTVMLRLLNLLDVFQ